MTTTIPLLIAGHGTAPPPLGEAVAGLVAETTPVAGVEYAFVSLAAPGVPAALDRCRSRRPA
jgi:sirohydrochlorin cobaltochelatase